MNAVKNWFLALAMLLCMGSIHAATNPIDSLKAVVAAASHDTSRAQALIKVGSEYFNTNLDSALHYWDAALKLGEHLLDDANKKINEAGKRIVMRSASNTAVVFQYRGLYPLALKQYQRTLRIAQELQDDRGTMIALNNIGLIKLSQEKPQEAMEEFLKCKALAEKLQDSMRTSTILNNIGTALKRLKRDDEALAKFRESIVWAEATGNEEQIVDDLINIGSIQVVRHEYDSAMVNFRRAWTTAGELEYSIAKPEILEGLSSAYAGLGKMDLALEYAQACLDSARSLDMTEQIIGGLEQLAEIQEKMGLYKEADQSLKEFIHLQDSFFNAEKTIEFGQLEQSFDYERQELQQQIADQEAKAALREANIRQYIISFGVVSLIALLMIVGLRYSKKRRLRYFVVFASLLVFFEFALVLLDSLVDGVTGGLPIPKLLANVLLAALIAPLNTVLEKRLVEARKEQDSQNR